MKQDRGLSRIELVVLLTLVAMVASLFLLRAGSSRESARRIDCENRLRSIFLGMQSYTLQYGHYPIGTQDSSSPIRSEPRGYHQNWISGLLPQLNQQLLFERIDFKFGVYADVNRPIGEERLAALMCASAGETLSATSTSYVGMTDSTETPINEAGDGMFLLNRRLFTRDVIDGENYVLLIGEKAFDFGPPLAWNSGTRVSLRTGGWPINAPPPSDVSPLLVGGLSSNHAGGVYGLMAGGEFRFLTDQTDPILLKQLVARDDSAAQRDEN